ncbi:NAD-dependent epimerase/dehydratase family protein [Planktotalea arctica]|uniref:NAD-dependent epimerase/dehydratase family protein n=1 Tax=Planktotalea arctica TaxID=1481893 RepID=UPI000A1770B3|nr:NAD-dependent epimerase/dehydratase family protein [Planktotalea arctica]
MRDDGTDAMGKVSAQHFVVTGAAGYLGRAIVRVAQTRGHRVTQVVRSGASGIAQDLAENGAAKALLEQIKSADSVIHAASEMSDDWTLHKRSSLPAARSVCALAEGLGAHLVHVSSIVIYDFAALKVGAIVDENSPIETAPEQRDGYVRAKLTQEEIITNARPDASVLRVGAIYGAGRITNAHLGIGLGPILLRLAAHGQVPLVHVELAAQIAVSAAEKKVRGAVNVLDSDLPDRIRFISALSASGWPKLVIPCPWQIFVGPGTLLGFWKRRPGLLRRRVLHARMKPLGYDNTLMRAQFDEVKMPAFEVLINRAMRDE